MGPNFSTTRTPEEPTSTITNQNPSGTRTGTTENSGRSKRPYPKQPDQPKQPSSPTQNDPRRMSDSQGSPTRCRNQSQLQEVDGLLQTSVMRGASTDNKLADANELFDTINIFHDAENCTVPHHAFADGSKLFDALVKEVLEVAASRVFSDAVEALKNRGVHMPRPPNKRGSADQELLRALSEEHKRLLCLPEGQQERVLEVILSGDRDFSKYVTDLTKTKATVVLIHTGESAPSFNNIVKRGQKKNCKPSWKHLVHSVGQNRNSRWV
eukprot:gb/GECG01006571.1/.p1 GENE.gb/GECG01006571.1/~~gb/GECG01006571.1/.p1  ORF type:complete len:268 (+),score=32.28 gb/GECG01006571.1/:1-804(+)